ncbi:MAG: phospho-N-acetylmuramoyl-pentapeptide-transferase [Acidimicrobiales bacterium]
MMAAGGAALLAAIFVTPLLIEWQRRRHIGQHIREDGPLTHQAKAGTPTMGGVGVVVSVIFGYFIAHFGPSVKFARTGELVIIAVFMFAAIGFVDDWIKVSRRRSLGLAIKGKLLAQVIAGVIFSELAVHWAHVPTVLSFTRAQNPGLALGEAGWVVLATLVLVATSNSVNFADGLDGLAAGSSTFGFAVLAIIGYWIFRHLSIFGILPAGALDLALSSVALAGGCLGFLWWNAAPARIIMGDTGSLGIGAGLAATCLLLNLDLLLPVIGGLFVIESLSVITQVVSFRVFGRRVLRMAPIHHHCELLGWPETTVIVRFWMLAGLFAALGLGIFYGEFLAMSAHTP